MELKTTSKNDHYVNVAAAVAVHTKESWTCFSFACFFSCHRYCDTLIFWYVNIQWCSDMLFDWSMAVMMFFFSIYHSDIELIEEWMKQFFICTLVGFVDVACVQQFLCHMRLHISEKQPNFYGSSTIVGHPIQLAIRSSSPAEMHMIHWHLSNCEWSWL